MRFLHRLKSKDISLTNSMIPLGSCTMKLNAASAMIPLSNPGFANLHPFAPKHQTQGYNKMIEELGHFLCRITDLEAVTFQPNSGAQGEYTGLLTIRHYQREQGQGHRDICLIPTSAHGTNPASAIKAGLKVVPLELTAEGMISLPDVRAKLGLHRGQVSCLMVTYPSTAGIFEDTVKELCRLVHEAGGQVYMDGANMNAQVGVTSPGFLGADVCHLNLHKTFSIPHGGGGPGMGPICVQAHLAKLLPTHFTTQPHSGFSVCSAPSGSASILIISYGYIRMLGTRGLRESTLAAILNASYLRACLKDHFPILSGDKPCAHEFIIDLRPLKASHQVSDEDVAKRLMDYGFHAPTMSFPVTGTLMVEPTESEDLGELDRFVQAMIAIRREIEECPALLHNAPHTAHEVCASDWKHPYSRERAAYPLPWIRQRGKFWPPVGRIDGVYGDKHPQVVLP